MKSFQLLPFLLIFFFVQNLAGQTIDTTYQKDVLYVGETHYFENGDLHKRGRWFNKTKLALGDSPEAMKIYKKSRNNNLVGFGIYAIGVGTYLFGHNLKNEDIELKSGLLAGAIGSFIITNALYKRSFKKFNDAVWTHNNEMWLKHRNEGEFPRDAVYFHKDGDTKKGIILHGGGVPFDCEKAFLTNSVAFEEYKKSKKNRRAASVILKLGLATIISSYWVDDPNWKTGLIFGGAGGAIIGSIPFTRKASKHFNNALWIYNNDQLLLK